jgi:pimeloyl-ACP methyl ester carboxylesterase
MRQSGHVHDSIRIRTFALRLAALCVIPAVALAACGLGSKRVPRFEPAECAFSPAQIANVECGYLIVPENREQPGGPTIRLHVAIAHSISADPEPDPLIYLSGGPGSSSLQWLYGNLQNYSNIRRERDVIFFDPRGVGLSEPSLDCPEVMDAFHETLDQPVSDGAWMDAMYEAAVTCRDRLLSSGIDLEAYHSAAMAADVNDLRIALGYDQVNLFGVSYGTRTAQNVMRDYPDTLRSVILDSVVPIEKDLFRAEAANAEQAMRIVFDHCAEDDICDRVYPTLPDVVDDLTEMITENPITITVRHLVSNQEYDVRVDRSLLGWGLIESLYNYETAIYLPKLVYETYLGENESYPTLATSLEIYLLYGDFSSEGHRYSVLCSDEGSFTTLDTLLESNLSVQPAIAEYFNREAELLYRICDIWGAKVADPIENQAVISDIPALILGGEYDPVTPPSYGRQLAENLANAHFVEFPGLGHFVFAEGRCPQYIVEDFLDDPQAAPDNLCPEVFQFNIITY